MTPRHRLHHDRLFHFIFLLIHLGKGLLVFLKTVLTDFFTLCYQYTNLHYHFDINLKYILSSRFAVLGVEKLKDFWAFTIGFLSSNVTIVDIQHCHDKHSSVLFSLYVILVLVIYETSCSTAHRF